MHDISSAEAHTLFQNNAAVILDVRTPSEFASGHIPNAKNIDSNSFSFEQEIKKLDTTKPYIVYCQTGGRSSRATALMQSLGFSGAKNLLGGITLWKHEGFPVEK